jgi:hypothetical protein
MPIPQPNAKTFSQLLSQLVVCWLLLSFTAAAQSSPQCGRAATQFYGERARPGRKEP